MRGRSWSLAHEGEGVEAWPHEGADLPRTCGAAASLVAPLLRTSASHLPHTPGRSALRPEPAMPVPVRAGPPPGALLTPSAGPTGTAFLSRWHCGQRISRPGPSRSACCIGNEAVLNTCPSAQRTTVCSIKSLTSFFSPQVPFPRPGSAATGCHFECHITGRKPLSPELSQPLHSSHPTQHNASHPTPPRPLTQPHPAPLVPPSTPTLGTPTTREPQARCRWARRAPTLSRPTPSRVRDTPLWSHGQRPAPGQRKGPADQSAGGLAWGTVCGIGRSAGLTLGPD